MVTCLANERSLFYQTYCIECPVCESIYNNLILSMAEYPICGSIYNNLILSMAEYPACESIYNNLIWSMAECTFVCVKMTDNYKSYIFVDSYINQLAPPPPSILKKV